MGEIYEIFGKAFSDVIVQFGVNVLETKPIVAKDSLIIEDDVTAFVGIIGEYKGNVAYSFSKDTAKKIASAMMMGMPVESMDDMARSAIAELSNMIAGHTVIEGGKVLGNCNITTPEVVTGEDVYLVLSQNKSRTVEISTSLGLVNISIGVEI